MTTTLSTPATSAATTEVPLCRPALKRFDVFSSYWGAFKIELGSVQQVFPDETDGWNQGKPGSVSMFQEELRSTVTQVRAVPR